MLVRIIEQDIDVDTYELVYVHGKLMGVEIHSGVLKEMEYDLLKKYYEEIDGLFFVETDNIEFAYGD